MVHSTKTTDALGGMQLLYPLRNDREKSEIIAELESGPLRGTRLSHVGTCVVRCRPDSGCWTQQAESITRYPTAISSLSRDITTDRVSHGQYVMYLRRVYGSRGDTESQVLLICKRTQTGHYYPKMHLAHIRFDASLFDGGTVFEGELFGVAPRRSRDDVPWIFVADDILAVSGTRVNDPNCTRRRHLMHRVLEDKHVPDPLSGGVIVRTRDHLGMSSSMGVISRLVDELDPSQVSELRFRVCHGTPGRSQRTSVLSLVIPPPETPSSLPDISKAESDSKQPVVHDDVWTPPPPPLVRHDATRWEGPTRVFWVRRTALPDVYELFNDSHQASTPIDTACVATIQQSKALRDVFQDVRNPREHSVAMRCVFNTKFNKWTPAEVVAGA